MVATVSNLPLDVMEEIASEYYLPFSRIRKLGLPR